MPQQDPSGWQGAPAAQRVPPLGLQGPATHLQPVWLVPLVSAPRWAEQMNE